MSPNQRPSIQSRIIDRKKTSETHVVLKKGALKVLHIYDDVKGHKKLEAVLLASAK